MRYNLVVATHHKTGTVWMDGVFKAIANDLGARYINFRGEHDKLEGLLDGPFVLFNHDSQFGDHEHILDRDDVKIMHLIRDPRDVVISAMHYHKVSRESWLHEPIPGYDNATYQRALRDQPTRRAQYVFEMENSSASTLRDMSAWRYDRPNCFEARYELLRQDTGLAYWRRIMSFFGLDDEERALAARSFWHNSLFGNLPLLGNKHVRSGAVAQWKHEFTPEIARDFLKRFPGILKLLGYETNDAWTRQLKRDDANGALLDLRHLVTHHWGFLTGRARTPLKL